MKPMKPLCVACGDTYSAARRLAGYQLCLPCGEDRARSVRHTIVPMHKSNYLLVTDRDDLLGINSKGGMYR